MDAGLWTPESAANLEIAKIGGQGGRLRAGIILAYLQILRFFEARDLIALPSPQADRAFLEDKQPRLTSRTRMQGVGPNRIYLEIPEPTTGLAYPKRPVPGTVANLDLIKYYCDYESNKFVRDCLEMLRVAGGLDSGHGLRRGGSNRWKYLYLEDEWTPEGPSVDFVNSGERGIEIAPDGLGLRKHPGVTWEAPLSLPPPHAPKPFVALSSPCDEDYPRIFHMFWTGPFTDKPYAAILSFLYTQNTGIHLPRDQASNVCRPQFWLWINPGPAASASNPSALDDMYEELKDNPWSAPFLHPRFRGVVSFKLWNTTEQLDSNSEVKEEWRSFKALFTSVGNEVSDSHRASIFTTLKGMFAGHAVDKLSTVMSDMARFLLLHRYGGVYLDADVLLLRDWEELWGWKGAFAYKWSQLPHYNTAILRMHKNSALGTFLIRTALKNDLDFHPHTISKYLKDGNLQELLFRIPDALFDPAWLNVEDVHQRERPPQPAFTKFGDFFETPAHDSAGPSALGFDGFFKGAYAYHWHNSYWTPFDRSRNWPELGPRFNVSEEAGRAAVEAKESGEMHRAPLDLDWSAIIKRTFEAYIRGERPNMYGENILW
ncbi:hypothetical protein HWV62_43226 [Athelia sp. TMB]|nr:hypothetical protein HWV62_43226 [Athelia sp. TMB]